MQAWRIGAVVGLCAAIGLAACDDEGNKVKDGRGEDASVDGGGADGGSADGGGSGEGDADNVADAMEDPEGDGGKVTTIDDVEPLPNDVALPIVFVHGYAGSAQQFQSQAMRYEANGYPVGRIVAYEHHGGMVDEDFVAGLSEVVDDTLEKFDVEQIYLIGHSRGTSVSSEYLGVEGNAAKVAKYISLDGFGCAAADAADIPCVAPSQSSLPGQFHVEVAVSAESFVMQYEHLIGEEPEIVDIEPQEEPVVISGRAVLFPENVGRADTTLEIWELEADTGHRAKDEPMATFEIDESGDFGPVTVDPETFYEMVLIPEGEGGAHHFYQQRFVRSTPFVRLLSGLPDGNTSMNTNSGDGHAAMVVSRMREWKTSDVLEIETTSGSGDEPAMNVITEESAGSGGPLPGFGNIGLHIHDDADTPGESTLELLPWFAEQSFQSGIDLYMPAADPPDGTITLTNLPYGEDRPQVIRVPNWASSEHRVTVMFSDYTQD